MVPDGLESDGILMSSVSKKCSHISRFSACSESLFDNATLLRRKYMILRPVNMHCGMLSLSARKELAILPNAS